MKENMKRIIALLLALVLVMSGVLSGIPGGGIASAEEAEEIEDISAPLSQEMAEWDIGAEIVGDWTGADFADETAGKLEEGFDEVPMEKEEGAPVGVAEKELENKSSYVDQEVDIEKGGKEELPLSDASFGEYDPVSTAEQDFYVEEAFSKEKEIEDATKDDAGYLAEEQGGSFLINEEESEGTETPILVGSNIDDDTITIYFTNADVNVNDGGWQDNFGKGYWYVAYEEGTNNKTGIEPMGYIGQYGNGYLYYATFASNFNKFRLLSVNNDGEWPGAINRTRDTNSSDGTLFKIGDGYPDYSNGQELHNAGAYSYPTPEPEPMATNAITIYFDSTLSSFVESADKNKQPKRSIPKSSSDAIYVCGHNDSGVYQGYRTMSRMSNDSTSTLYNIWTVTVDSTRYKQLVFQNVPGGGAPPEKSGRTIKLETPPSGDKCFFCDAGDPYIKADTYRQGYWGDYSATAKRDPDIRAAVTPICNPKDLSEQVGTFANYYKTESDKNENGVVNVKGSTTPIPKRNYVSMTLYDYYTDWELNGQNRDNYWDSFSSSYWTWTPFRQFNRALSKEYEANTISNPLYVGQFQPEVTYNVYYHDYRHTVARPNQTWGLTYNDIATGSNNWFWLYNYNNDTKNKFEATNNSAKDSTGSTNDYYQWYHNGDNDSDGIDQAGGFFDYATQGLVKTSLVNDTLMLPDDSDGTKFLPFFNKTWLEGGNKLNTHLGKVYQNVGFPFKKETGSDGVDYWVYDSATTSMELKKTSAGKLLLEESTQSSTSENKNSGGDGTSTYGFFPFNGDATATEKYNYGYGARIDIPFSLPENRKVKNNSNGDADIIFEFSGDDDVWIFIDEHLVLDIGGDHGKVTGTINFSTGVATVSKVKTSPSSVQIISSHTKNNETGEYVDTISTLGTAGEQKTMYFGNLDVCTNPTGDHTLTMFYMERGMWESNMKITYNFPTENVFELEKKVVSMEITDPEIGDDFRAAIENHRNFPFVIKNLATHYGTQEAEEVLPDSTPYNDLFNGKVHATVTENTMEYVASMGNRDHVVHWRADYNDDALNIRQYRYGVVGPETDDVDISGKKYLDFDIYIPGTGSTDVALSNMYVQLLDNNDPKHVYGNLDSLGSAKTYLSTRTSEPVTITKGTWITIHVDLTKLDKSNNDFALGHVTEFRFGCDKGYTDIYLDNIRFSTVPHIEGKVGFTKAQEDIPDYDSAVQANGAVEMKPIKWAAYTRSTDGKKKVSYKVGEDGKVLLKNNEYISFSDQFRLGSYISVVENPDNSRAFNELFDVSWAVYQYDETIPGYETTPYLTSTPGISDTAITDSRTEPYDGSKKSTTRTVSLEGGETENVTTTNTYPDTPAAGTRPTNPSSAILFRSRLDTSSNPAELDNDRSVKLKAVYTNKVKVGQLTIRKEQDAISNLNVDDSHKYVFTVTFTNVGGMDLADGPIVKTVMLKIGTEETISGIPVGTDFTIVEGSPSLVESGARQKSASIVSYIDSTVSCGTVNDENGEISVSGTIGPVTNLITNHVKATFVNTNEPMAEVSYQKIWQDYDESVLDKKNDLLNLPGAITAIVQRRVSTATEESDWQNYRLITVTPGLTGTPPNLHYEWRWKANQLEARTGTSPNFTYYNYRVVETTGTELATATRLQTGGTISTGFKLRSEINTGTSSSPEQAGTNIYVSTQTNRSVGTTAVLTKIWAGGNELTTAKFRLERTAAESFGAAQNGEISTVGTWTLVRTGTSGNYELTVDSTNSSVEAAITPAPYVIPEYNNTTGVWTFTVEGLARDNGESTPATYKYRFVEMNSSSDLVHGSKFGNHVVTYGNNPSSGSLPEPVYSSTPTATYSTEITNTYPTVTVSVLKEWYGEDGTTKITASEDLADYPPVTVTLQQKIGDGSFVTYTDVMGHNTGEWVLSNSNSWSEELTGLPKYVNGQLAQYHFVENSAPLGYSILAQTYSPTVTDASDSTTTYTSTIKNMPEMINITVKKNWKRWTGSAYSVLTTGVPTSVTVALQRTNAENPNETDWTTGGFVALVRQDGNSATGSNYDTLLSSAASGNTYTVAKYNRTTNPVSLWKYRFVEVAVNSGVPTQLGNDVLAATSATGVTYYTHTVADAGESLDLMVSGVEQTLVNRDKPVKAKLTKTWPTGRHSASIKVQLQRTTASAWSEVATYTISYQEANGSNPASLNVSSASPSATAVLSGENWVLTTVETLEVCDATGAKYKYRFVEMDGTAVKGNGSVIGGYTVSYGNNVSVGEYAEATYNSVENSFNQEIANTKEQYTAVLTKVWPSSSAADSIEIWVEKADSSDTTFSHPTVLGKFTLAKTNLNQAPTCTDVSGASNSVTGLPGIVTGTNNWTLTINGLDKYDDSNNIYQYRFVEVNNGSYATQGAQVGAYLVSYANPVVNNIGKTSVDSQDATKLVQTITNTPAKIKFIIKKLVSGTYNTASVQHLDGATFTLKRTTGTERSWTLTTPGTGGTGIVNIVDATPVGHNESIAEGLGDGGYELYESVAPLGYAMHSGKVTFTVQAGAIITTGFGYSASGLIADSLSGGLPPASVSGGITTYTFWFENTAGTELPGTGTVFGLSRMGFASLGTVLLAAFVVVYQYKKRRQYNGDWKE